MKFFHDDRALVAELLGDKRRLIADNVQLQQQFQQERLEYRQQLSGLLEELRKLAAAAIAQSPAPEPPAKTRIPVPEYLREQIDWGKLGMEAPDVEQMLTARSRK